MQTVASGSDSRLPQVISLASERSARHHRPPRPGTPPAGPDSWDAHDSGTHMTLTDWADVAQVTVAAAIVASLLQVALSNRRLAASLRLNSMQQMISELNRLRQVRMNQPDLERSLFPERALWTDEGLRKHLVAVQLANMFEWAYFSRREGLLPADVWLSWIDTWHSVIVSSPGLREAFAESVWTFGREEPARQDLRDLVFATGVRTDPYFARRAQRRLPSFRHRHHS
jgi:hypothetical protein